MSKMHSVLLTVLATIFLMFALIVNEAFGYAGLTLGDINSKSAGYGITIGALAILGFSILISFMFIFIRIEAGELIFKIIIHASILLAYLLLVVGIVFFAKDGMLSSLGKARQYGIWIGAIALYTIGFAPTTGLLFKQW
ncbi:hypothetical protein [Spiroplasma endosymbiont of Aspidapion aeneum]|uniref:hypothetical protein n=1 Tax=Spiroplasma endosymbiont of Aspidapion aeneum TaxID=3066276 RepID=UPI00313E4F16